MRGIWLLPSLLLLTGCGDDKPHTGPPPGVPHQARAVPANAAPLAEAPPDGPTDPLVGGAEQTPVDPLLGRDSSLGAAMPTKHSHWLNAEMRMAHMTVQLNGVRLGAFVPRGTQDVTMKLHPGINKMTVIYVPRDENSWGSVTMTEGEHDSNAVLLATFHQAPLSRSSAPDTESVRTLKPVTKTVFFRAQ